MKRLDTTRGKAEDSIVIEIVDAKAAPVRALAKKIRQLTGQKSVLVMSLSGQARKIPTQESARNSGPAR